INLSASPYSITKQGHRDKILTDACKSVRAHILYCNLVGGQDELVFDGRSRLMSPAGKTLTSLKAFKEDYKVLNFHKKTVEKAVKIEYRSSAGPKEIPEKQDELRDILSALELGLRDYVQKNKFSKVLIGLSGGVDSALAAALAVRALGNKSVIGVTMPSVYSSKSTYRDAFKSAEVCGIQIYSIPIRDIHDQMLNALHPLFKKTEIGVAEENLQARIRGSILMSLSNKFNWLVLTTGNKSEMATGYCTLYGDMCGGFAPIKDLSKTLVYKLCRYINKIERKEMIPLSVIRRAPTAELRPNQKDRDSLPPYSELDKILEQYVELDMPSTSFKTKIKRQEVKKIISMVNRNEYKRRQAAIGTKITSKAFGKDRRLPVTNGFQL
ncbi:MAG: NAD+ synthase, partial [Candidatus Omnitrophica bacterium]|nr:NAD+ synthase [Candidatus Omnitrophota bacterium]